ncbi:hypothetical protein J7T55_002651 [Diaporthe amygdali]|uniref:uncharacterized protein n=1 Tax=Phomopsis amygdali TaxID=1214568 RepID=UPI0022FEF08A|nr:uncharacterized protein J7T55_002651 [Diaporthe amygdali]KAJ0122139.1 hypothetical protein J7T55_002651 [Diaporthe amygdali]
MSFRFELNLTVGDYTRCLELKLMLSAATVACPLDRPLNTAHFCSECRLLRRKPLSFCLGHGLRDGPQRPAAAAGSVSTAQRIWCSAPKLIVKPPYLLESQEPSDAVALAAANGELSRGGCSGRLRLADTERLHKLALDEATTVRWTGIAYGLQKLAVDYEPGGRVGVIDVFHAEPLRVASPTREAWVSRHLSLWQDFCRTEPRMHEAGGGHYTILRPDSVASFAKTLRAASEPRGM